MDQSNENITDYQPIQLKPVGVVRNRSKKPSWGGALGALDWQERAARMKEQGESVSELVIDSSLEGILDGIDDFSHIMVIYWAHLTPPERRSTTKVHPIGNKDFPLVGVFATRSPVRPNSILTTVVRLVGRNGNVLRVTGLDALDGSPILDIKPYFRDTPGTDEIKVPDWMRDIHQTFTEEAPSE
jgi:tRNA-Thr(GGU) m(6)t(6)A37 methyltransferase TsaA